MPQLTRRGFIASAACLALSPRPGLAATHSLTATTRVLDINGRAATVLGLVDAQGRPGLTLDPGARFAVDLTNALDMETLIHWHGQIPPNAQDGVPGMPAPLLRPGETRSYDFAARPGTHWMHAHIPAQEVGLLAAPLIVREATDRQEVTLFLHDFSFTPAEEVLATITGGMAMAGHDMGAMDMEGMGHDMSKMGGMAMDLNDFDFDAYLANDRTLDDPQVVTVDPDAEVLLRIVNAGSATVFWIDTGALTATVLAVDGEKVQPLTGTRFGLAMGQRLDLGLNIPRGAHPILALREGAVERTGIILATPGAKVAKVAPTGDLTPGWSDLTQESALRALVPLTPRPATQTPMVMLGGQMMPYRWTLDGAVWGDHKPLRATSGQRVEVMFHNMSMMSHPMHLHGHKFQVVDTGAGRFAGALRDTVLVPPMGMVTVALDAGEAASWMLHCHHMAHLATGMMTEFIVS
ncbi:multicopper oxidase family protein [Rhodobacter sp. KR11]|uniref:multicopper oxidase family protein n=1 Tax=Rhodobacter sp. KR11 TaxID=2974588 RepID=UPI002221D1AC|nr:multicopper oxidase family protein [Rhodobacter sp. KR11]MCW1920465.1 multicopper oxidase family protein [Rhodobacter sp. KR11]